MTQTPVLPLLAPQRERLSRLIAKSHEDYIDFQKSIDWSIGADTAKLPKREEHCWLYGTEHWARLSADRRRAMAWEEMGRDISMFILLEEDVPTLYVGYINKYRDALDPNVREYLKIFSKEELVHTFMFERYMDIAGLKLFRHPPGLHEFFTTALPSMNPVIGVLAGYVTEYVAELAAMAGTDAPDVDPLTRQIATVHHHEELRHLAFGRWVVESHLATGGERAALALRPIVEPYVSRLIAQFTFNPEIIERMGGELEIDPNDAEVLHAIRRSENNRRINDERFGVLLTWLKRLGLVAPDYEFIS